MTPSPQRLRYIIAGLKLEIKRETDPERLFNLATLGNMYNRLLTKHAGRFTFRTCNECGEERSPQEFDLVIGWNPSGKKIAVYRLTCKTCENRKRVQRNHAKRMKQKVSNGQFQIGKIICY